MTNQSGEAPAKRMFTDPQWGGAGASTPKFSASTQSAEASVETSPVRVVDINMPFWSMVRFMVKWVIASIPALLILAVILAVLMWVFGGILITKEAFIGR